MQVCAIRSSGRPGHFRRAALARRVLACSAIGFFALVAIPRALEAQEARASNEATFTKDVAPILQRSCQVCHRPGAIAPMSLLTYEEARPWARSIGAKVANREMPPWYVDKTVGIQKFKGDRSLTDREIATIVRWVDGGAPRGRPSDMPPPVTFPDYSKWTNAAVLGPPDLIVQMPKPFEVQPGNPNQWYDFLTGPVVTEDRWIRAVETKPSSEGFPVVHHASTHLISPDADEVEVLGDDDPSIEMLGEYALGKTGDIFPEGTGRLLKAGMRFRFGMHYSANPNGKPTTDRTSTALWLYPKGVVPKHQIVRAGFGSTADLDLPAGESDIRHDSFAIVRENVRLTVVQPHLHNRGKRQCINAIYPGGRTETLNCINWSFGWHIAYNYEEDAQPLLPKGTILHVIHWHDNSAANRWNPDPQNWAGYGQRSTDDMALTHAFWYTLTDEEFKKAAADRKAAAASRSVKRPAPSTESRP